MPGYAVISFTALYVIHCKRALFSFQPIAAKGDGRKVMSITKRSCGKVGAARGGRLSIREGATVDKHLSLNITFMYYAGG
jgi:hypothetical protein